MSGVVPIFATVWEEHLDGQPTMTVTDPGGTVVGGTLEHGGSRVVWRSSAPLSPQTTYNARIIAGGFHQVDFTFTTASDDNTPTLSIAPGDLHLYEYNRANKRVCCNSGESSCGGPWRECWTRTADKAVELSGRFTVGVEAARYYRFVGEAADGEVAWTNSAGGEGNFSVHFTPRDESYCITIRAQSLLDGPDVTETICQSPAALQEAEAFTPDTPDYSICDEPPFDPDTGEEVSTGGCSAAGAGAGPLLLLLGVFGLIRRRRRMA